MTPESMHHTDNQISKMRPGLDKLLSVENPAAPTEVEIEAEVEENGLTAELVNPAQELEEAELEQEQLKQQDPAPPPPQMLDEVVSYLRRYLVCNASTYRGYRLQNFEDAWERYLPPLTVCSRTETAFATNAATVNS